MLGPFHKDLESKHFRTFSVVRSRNMLSHLDDNLCFVKVPMRQQQQNQNRKKQPANLPKTVSRVRLRFSFLFTRIICGNYAVTPSRRHKDLVVIKKSGLCSRGPGLWLVR